MIQTLTTPHTLQQSRDFCERVTRQFARNFYYGLRLLPADKRAAMYALYAWMRLVDDAADEEDGRSIEQRIAQLDAWKQDTHAVLALGPQAATTRGAQLWPAFAHLVHTYRIPTECFDEVIAGQQQDMRGISFRTFDELHQYCYRVAGVVGLASLYVWGFEDGQETRQFAIDRGVAFQLTNILRDLREDAARGRTYLPSEELQRFGVTHDQLRSADATGRFVDLMNFQVQRAQSYYDRSAPLEARISADSRPTLVAMTQIYHGLLAKVAADPSRVLRQRVSLSLWSKLRIGWKALRAR